jgi:hypothetical protein
MAWQLVPSQPAWTVAAAASRAADLARETGSFEAPRFSRNPELPAPALYYFR